MGVQLLIGAIRSLPSGRSALLKNVLRRQVWGLSQVQRVVAPLRKLPLRWLPYPKTLACLVIVGTRATLQSLAGSQYESPTLRKIRVRDEGVMRTIRIAWAGFKTSLDYKYVFWYYPESDPLYDQALHQCHERAARRILQVCLRNGGLYVKVGQGLASFDHILPSEYIKILAVLHDKALTREYREVDRIFREELGHPPSAFFLEFDETPVAAASLAQVHRAVMMDGTEVAVKVQYADLRDRFDGDMHACQLLLYLVTLVHPKFQFGWILPDIRSTLEKELDFILEADNNERCRENLKHITGVHVPVIYHQLTSKRILTAEYIHGCKANDIKTLTNERFNIKRIVSLVVEAMATQIFIYGDVHADPHPGNILIRRSSDGREEVVLIDHGLYVKLPDHVRLSFCRLWRAIVLRDTKDLYRSSRDMGVEEATVFAGLIVQQPYYDIHQGVRLLLTKEDVRNIKIYVRDQMDSIVGMLKRMPRPLLLVLRNINIVRALNKELGVPINRFDHMARFAVRGLARDQAHDTWKGCVSEWRERIIFELCIDWARLKKATWAIYFRVLQYLDMLPADLGFLDDFIMAP